MNARASILRRPLRDELGGIIECAGCMQHPRQPATHRSADSGEPCCDACQRIIDAWVAADGEPIARRTDVA